LIFRGDDGIVVGGEARMEKLKVEEYFELPESPGPMELVHGVIREPPAPRYGHQNVLTHLGALLDRHVREHALGEVCVAPVDVVLDVDAALVVQPDIIFVSRQRLSIVRDRVWGAPDLVVEVLSPGSARRDRTTKLGWYRDYGVGECWLVDLQLRHVDVVELGGGPGRSTRFPGESHMTSRVLPRWTIGANEVFG
jgi:Uma2 family endonuclease